MFIGLILSCGLALGNLAFADDTAPPSDDTSFLRSAAETVTKTFKQLTGSDGCAQCKIDSANPSNSRSIFDPARTFKCSPQKNVGCSGIFPVRNNNDTKIALLTSGEDSLAARIQTINQAKKSIRIQALIFTGDESGLYIAELLKKKKKEHPEMDIRIVIDGFSNPSLQTQFMYYDLKQHGIPVEGYVPVVMTDWLSEASSKDPMNPNKRFHDKIWVIDGEDPKNAVAIVGGRNIANEYFRMGSAKAGKDAVNKWRDQDLLVKGGAIEDVVKAFDRNYIDSKALKRSVGLLNSDLLWKRWEDYVIKPLGKSGVPFKRSPEIQARVEKVAARADELTYEYTPATVRFFQSRPRKGETYIKEAYVQQIDASDEILIANAYFVPTQEIMSALKRAVKRGAQVKILTNSKESNDLKILSDASRYTYKELLDTNKDPESIKNRGKMQVYEWDGLKHGWGTIHAKYAAFRKKDPKTGVLEGSSGIIGSYNLDPRSEELNSETVMAFESEAMARKLANQYLRSDLSKSREVTAKEAEVYHDPKNAWRNDLVNVIRDHL